MLFVEDRKINFVTKNVYEDDGLFSKDSFLCLLAQFESQGFISRHFSYTQRRIFRVALYKRSQKVLNLLCLVSESNARSELLLNELVDIYRAFYRYFKVDLSPSFFITLGRTPHAEEFSAKIIKKGGGKYHDLRLIGRKLIFNIPIILLFSSIVFLSLALFPMLL